MAEIIDINRRLEYRRMANILARGGKIYCHPTDREMLKDFPDSMIEISDLMRLGEICAIDCEAFLMPENLCIHIDWAKN